MKRIILSAFFVSLFAVAVLGSTALADEPLELNKADDVLPEMEPQLVDEVHIVAYDGDADLNAICAFIMFGFGSVCGLLAGSEVVRKWTL